jgi:hypothetical protein
MRTALIVGVAVCACPLVFGQTIYVQPSNPYSSTSSSIALRAYCTSPPGGPIVPNCTVSLSNTYFLNTNGHVASNHATRTPSTYGYLSSYGGYYSGYNGWPFTFYASRVGDQEYINVCPPPGGTCGGSNVQVSFQDIYLYLGASSNVLIGGTVYHPLGNNHGGTLSFNSSVSAVTNQY